jgi:hypothetical protein
MKGVTITEKSFNGLQIRASNGSFLYAKILKEGRVFNEKDNSFNFRCVCGGTDGV